MTARRPAADEPAPGPPTPPTLLDDVTARVPAMVEEVVRRVVAADEHWGDDRRRTALASMVSRMLAIDLDALVAAAGEPERTAAVARGDVVSRALGGEAEREAVPLASVLKAAEISLHHLWDVVCEAASRVDPSPAGVLSLASRMLGLEVRRRAAMTEGWTARAVASDAGRDARREELIQSLLLGERLTAIAVWELADVLGLPTAGPFVAVVCTAAVVDAPEPDLGETEQQLLGIRFASVWQASAATLIGVVALGSFNGLDALLQVLRTVPSHAMGVSPVYARLADTGEAVRLARVAHLAVRQDRPADRVLAFGRHALAVTAVSAPEINRRVAHDVFADLDALPVVQRDRLLGTLEAWIDADGSTDLAARALFLHRNTVRQRLARLERLTRRSLTSPQQVAELCIALATVRRAFDDVPSRAAAAGRTMGGPERPSVPPGARC